MKLTYINSKWQRGYLIIKPYDFIASYSFYCFVGLYIFKRTDTYRGDPLFSLSELAIQDNQKSDIEGIMFKIFD